MSVAFLKGYLASLGSSALLPAADDALQALLEIYMLYRLLDELGDHLTVEVGAVEPEHDELHWSDCHAVSLHRFRPAAWLGNAAGGRRPAFIRLATQASGQRRQRRITPDGGLPARQVLDA